MPGSLPALQPPSDRIGSFSHALSLAGQAAAAAPLSPDAWFIKGLALYRRGDYAGAEDAFYQAVALVPDHTEAWFFCGNCFYLSGEVEKSLECFDRVLNISGRYPKALYNKGVSLADLGRFEEAVEAYRACLDMSPGVAVVLSNLGVALANLGQSEEAIRAFDEALAIDPRDPITWHNKGMALAKSGREAEAMDCFSHYRDLAGTGKRLVPASGRSGEIPDPSGYTGRDGHMQEEKFLIRSAERFAGPDNRPGHVIGGTESRMGKKVDVVVSHDGRDIVCGVKKCIKDNAPQHQHREESGLFILPEEIGNRHHDRHECKDAEEHAGDHAERVKTDR